MKRKIVYAVIILICFFVDSLLFGPLRIGAIKPNILLLITASFGFMHGKKDGLFIGFFSGLLIDVFFGNYLGFYALIYMLLGYCNGFFKQIFFDEDIKLPLVLISGTNFIYGILIYVCFFMLRGQFNFLFHLTNIIIPEMLYTMLCALIIYRIMLRINQRLEVDEQRSASKFV